MTVCSTLAGANARAQLLADSARQWSEGSWKLSAYYQGSQSQDLNFELSAGGSCTASNGLVFPCSQAGNVQGHGSGDAGMLKLAYQPGSMFRYFVAFGEGLYSLTVPGTSAQNVFSGGAPGLILGAGVKAVIVPDTIVSPAVAFEASAWRSAYTLSGLSSAGASQSVADDLFLTQYQAAAETSHVFSLGKGWRIDPYGGVKWYRLQTDLHDLRSGSYAGGQEDVVTPFLGFRLPLGKNVACFGEASFIGGYQYAGGLEIGL